MVHNDLFLNLNIEYNKMKINHFVREILYHWNKPGKQKKVIKFCLQ